MKPTLLIPLTIFFVLIIMPSLSLLPTKSSLPGILTLLPLLLPFPLGLSRHLPPRIRYYLNLTKFTLSLAVTSIWGVLVSLGLTLVGRRGDINWAVARSFYHLTSPLIGWKVVVEGEGNLEGVERGQPAVLVGNHQSMIDILYLGRVFPRRCSIMAKKELKWTPFLGLYMILSRAVFVNRSDRKNAVKTFAKVADEMKSNGMSLMIFAEGTRSNTPTPTLLPFKKGAFHLALQAGVPIIPMVCSNYHGLYSGKEGRFEEGGEVKVKVLEPVDVGQVVRERMGKVGNGGGDEREGDKEGEGSTQWKVEVVMDEVRKRMLRALEEMADEEKRGPSGVGNGNGAAPASGAAVAVGGGGEGRDKEM